MTFTSLADCDLELKRVNADITEAIKTKAFWKLPRLRKRKFKALERRNEMLHRDFFLVLGQERPVGL